MSKDNPIGMSAIEEAFGPAVRAEEPGRARKNPDMEIAYQNKDIASKLFTERLKGKSFSVYGLEIPEVREILPTNIPLIKVNELRLDNLLGLEDKSAAVVDYESDYKRESKVKYLNYLTGIVGRYESQTGSCPNLRMIVIYTGDVKREEVSESYDVGAVKLVIEPVFLSEVDGDEIFSRLREKVENEELLSDQEQMELVFFPLTYRKKEEKRRRIGEAVELASRIQNREQQVFVLAGIMTFTDKVIDEDMINEIRRRIGMTKIGMMIEREKEEAIEKAIVEERRRVEEAQRRSEEAQRRSEEAQRKSEEAQRRSEEAQRETEKARKALKDQGRKSALEMLRDRELPLTKIARYSGLDIAMVAELAKSLS